LAGPVPANKIDSDEQLINDTIKKTDLFGDVIITGYLTDDDLNLFYENALAYVFPSINEGFGIPILEAFKHNLPALVANNTCLPEVGGDAILQFNPFDVDDIASKIKMVLEDTVLREDMINKGQERLKYFSWQNTAMGLIKVFKGAI
jgi:glycosyltransferase involved in cell wall biosynthesis